MDSLIIQCAKATAVPAGNSLSVNRAEFGKLVTEKIEETANITVVRKKVEELDPEALNIIATGPVTEEGFAQKILSLIGENSLYFYDAIAPILDADSIDYDIAFWADRYQEEDSEEVGDYLNIPFDRETYEAFVESLINAEKIPTKDFEKEKFFEACLPIEVVASRGIKTLAFGILKPIGLHDKDGNKFHAVMQLRKENKEGTALNMVGCQTRMKYGEQKRVFSMIPALRNAEFFRYGSMHRNTFLNAPQVLKSDFSLKKELLEEPSEMFGGKTASEKLYFAGQITGVEGYIESAASGLLVGLNVVNLLEDKEPVSFPRITALGALNSHIGSELKRYQPSNVNYSMVEPLEKRIRNKQEKQKALSDRSLAWFAENTPNQ